MENIIELLKLLWNLFKGFIIAILKGLGMISGPTTRLRALIRPRRDLLVRRGGDEGRRTKDGGALPVSASWDLSPMGEPVAPVKAFNPCQD